MICMYLSEQQKVANCANRERYGDCEREQAQDDADERRIEEREGGEEAAVARSVDAERLVDQHEQLEKEDHEEDHEVETRVGAERLVDRTVPADERSDLSENGPRWGRLGAGGLTSTGGKLA